MDIEVQGEENRAMGNILGVNKLLTECYSMDHIGQEKIRLGNPSKILVSTTGVATNITREGVVCDISLVLRGIYLWNLREHRRHAYQNHP